MVHRKVAEKSPKSHRDSPAIGLNLSIIVLHQALGHYPHPFDSHSPGLSVGDFGLRGLSASTHISTLTLPVDCPVIFATRIVRQYAYQHAGPSRGLSAGDIRHEDCPWVIFATRTVRQYTYQHAGPSRGLSGLSVGDFRHEDCPWVIFATRTVRQTHISTLAHPADCPVIFATMTIRQYAYQHAGPSRGLSVGVIRHEDCPWVIFATRTVRQYAYQHAGPSRDCPVIFATRTVRQYAYQHAGPSRGLSGDFRHDDYPPVRISARWPFPWTIRGDIRHEDCPWVIFATRTVRQHAYQHAGPSRGLSAVIFATRTVRLSAGDFRHEDCPPDAYQHAGPSRGLSGDFRHEDCPPVRISARWPFPWTIRGDFRHEDCPWDCPWVIFATRTVRQHAYQHAGPSRGLSGDFRHEDCPPVRISARWPFPWTIRGDFRHEDCPWVIFATRTVRGDFRHEDCPPARISARWPFPWTIRGDFRHEECPWRQRAEFSGSWQQGHSATYNTPPRFKSPAKDSTRRRGNYNLAVRTRSRTDLANDTRLWEPAPTEGRQSGGGRCAASSPDSDLEALSHNPAHGSFGATGFSTKRDDQLCESTVPLAFSRIPLVRISVLSWLFDARESSRRAAPSPPPPTRGGPLATLAAQAARQQSTGSNWDPEPSPQSQSFSGYGSILPTSLPTLFHRPEAVHLGDLMRYEYDRRERTRSSGFSRAGMHRHHATRRRSRSVGCAPVRDPANQLPYALRVYSPVDSHTCQTPWSVFQDGSNGEPTGRRPEHADAEARREARAADHDKAATPPLAQRRGATGSARRALTSLAPLSRELGPGPSLRTLPDYTNAKTPDFQAGLFPFAAVTKGILLSDQTIDDLTRIEFTTACQDALASLARILANRVRNTRRPASVRYPREDWGTTICDTQADVPRQKAWGATCAQRLDGSRILQFTPSIDFATLFIDASRDIRCRVALDFTLQHRFQQTPPPVGESRLFS
ncbi:hypothetical protein Bca4012_102616 [Brassica carinata]